MRSLDEEDRPLPPLAQLLLDDEWVLDGLREYTFCPIASDMDDDSP